MSGYYDGLNLKLLAAIPDDARNVLELGCANGRLGRRFKETHPGVQWCGVDLSADASAAAAQHLDRVVTLDLDRADLSKLGGGFDVIVIGDLLEHLHAPGALLEALYDLTARAARIVCCVPNMGHLSVIERLVCGDISYDDAGLLDTTHTRFFSVSSAFKTFLDAGWLPHLHDQYRVEVPASAFARHLVEAAVALGLPAQTARLQFGLYQMILVCEKWPMQALMQGGPGEPFSVIVPVNRRWQYELNIARSPGLREVGADVVPVAGAASAAEAYAQGSRHARHAWRVLVHQDVYFPTGSGYALAQQLGALQRVGEDLPPVGFAGLEIDDDGTGLPRHAGLVIDRTTLFRHGCSATAVSIDELAVALHRDAPLTIDTALGWDLWATDLCLQARERTGRPSGRIVEVPLFHNSVNAYTLPPAFHHSAAVLLDKYPAMERIPTLCGMLSRSSNSPRAPGLAPAADPVPA